MAEAVAKETLRIYGEWKRRQGLPQNYDFDKAGWEPVPFTLGESPTSVYFGDNSDYHLGLLTHSSFFRRMVEHHHSTVTLTSTTPDETKYKVEFEGCDQPWEITFWPLVEALERQKELEAEAHAAYEILLEMRHIHPIISLPCFSEMVAGVGAFRVSVFAGQTLEQALAPGGSLAQLSKDQLLKLAPLVPAAVMLVADFIENMPDGARQLRSVDLSTIKVLKVGNKYLPVVAGFFGWCRQDKTDYFPLLNPRAMDPLLAAPYGPGGAPAATTDAGVEWATNHTTDACHSAMLVQRVISGDPPALIDPESYDGDHLDPDYLTELGKPMARHAEVQALPPLGQDYYLWCTDPDASQRPQTAEEALQHEFLADAVGQVLGLAALVEEEVKLAHAQLFALLGYDTSSWCATPQQESSGARGSSSSSGGGSSPTDSPSSSACSSPRGSDSGSCCSLDAWVGVSGVAQEADTGSGSPRGDGDSSSCCIFDAWCDASSVAEGPDSGSSSPRGSDSDSDSDSCCSLDAWVTVSVVAKGPDSGSKAALGFSFPESLQARSSSTSRMSACSVRSAMKGGRRQAAAAGAAASSQPHQRRVRFSLDVAPSDGSSDSSLVCDSRHTFDAAGGSSSSGAKRNFGASLTAVCSRCSSGDNCSSGGTSLAVVCSRCSDWPAPPAAPQGSGCGGAVAADGNSGSADGKESSSDTPIAASNDSSSASVAAGDSIGSAEPQGSSGTQCLAAGPVSSRRRRPRQALTRGCGWVCGGLQRAGQLVAKAGRGAAAGAVAGANAGVVRKGVFLVGLCCKLRSAMGS